MLQNKAFYVTLVVLLVGFIGLIIWERTNGEPEPPRPGVEQSDQGREHARKEYGGDEPPTSGPHADPVAWGLYRTEIRDDEALHNLEHGGVYVSYRPDLPEDEVDKLKALLFAPYSDSEFQPRKIIMAPRENNKAPIVLSSWLRSEKLENFDAEKIKEYVTRNTGKSPEPFAQ